MAVERQASALPSAQPSYILRGHTAQIHSVQFVRRNSRLITGDGDGWVIYWKLETKRALAVWRAHDGPILGTAAWGGNNLITHGRDNNLRIWQLRQTDEALLSTTLPAEDPNGDRPKPWLLHTLPVNTLNFCAFSACNVQLQHQNATVSDTNKLSDSILVAVPARDDKKIEVYQFPEERLRFVVPKVQTNDTGMVMAVKLMHHTASNSLLALVGYEGGFTAVHRLPSDHGSSLSTAELLNLSQPHKQPILSLDVSPDGESYFTSSADAIIATHRISEIPLLRTSTHSFTISHQPENGKAVNYPTLETQDSSTAEVTPTIQSVDSMASISEDPHTASSSSTLEFAKKPISPASPLSFTKQAISTPSTTSNQPAGLSSLLSSAPPHHGFKPFPPLLPPITIQPAHKTTNTKHSGQQSLRVRSDNRLLVTGGWDSRIRIYSTKTLKEVAVLKWHKDGVYAVDFAAVLQPSDLTQQEEIVEGQVVKRETGLGKLQRQREIQMQLKHWVAAGAKDGKVSLWEVF